MGLLVLAGGLFPNWIQGITANAANAWVGRMAASLDSRDAMRSASFLRFDKSGPRP
jgi:hypothetical protein